MAQATNRMRDKIAANLLKESFIPSMVRQMAAAELSRMSTADYSRLMRSRALKNIADGK